jgi:hypothetical protein
MNDTIGLAVSPWKGRYKSCSHSGYKNALTMLHSCHKYESKFVLSLFLRGVSVRIFTYKKQDCQPQIPGMSNNSSIYRNCNFDVQINLLA